MQGDISNNGEKNIDHDSTLQPADLTEKEHSVVHISLSPPQTNTLQARGRGERKGYYLGHRTSY